MTLLFLCPHFFFSAKCFSYFPDFLRSVLCCGDSEIIQKQTIKCIQAKITCPLDFRTPNLSLIYGFAEKHCFLSCLSRTPKYKIISLVPKKLLMRDKTPYIQGVFFYPRFFAPWGWGSVIAGRHVMMIMMIYTAVFFHFQLKYELAGN